MIKYNWIYFLLEEVRMRSKKMISLLIVLALLLCIFVACDNDLPSEEPLVGRVNGSVHLVSVPDGVEKYDEVDVFVEETPLELFNVKVNNSHSWTANPTNRSNSGVGYFSLVGKTTITVKSDNMESCIVRPLSAGVTAIVNEGTATFVIKSAGTYSIEPNGDPKQAFFLFVSEKEENYSYYGNVIRIEAGLHTSSNSDYIKNNTVNLYSNTIVILEEGAVVRARFVANNASNISIIGKGIIDGSAFVRNASTGEVTVPLDFNYCSDILLKDFSVLDPAGWCVNWYFCNDSEIDGIKIISSRSNGDGISLQSCKDIEVKNCFLRTWDDSLVVKNYANYQDKSIEGETENIEFSDCIIWTDLAQSMEIGYETIGKKLQKVTFRNITVLHNFHKPVMSIHNANNADIKDILFDTITVEDASMGRGDAGSNNQLIEIAVEFSNTWSTNHKTTALGSINGVTVKNISVLSGNIVLPIRVVGSLDSRTDYKNSIHRVSNVSIENLWINGKGIKSGYSYLSVNKYAEAEIVEPTEEVKVKFIFSQNENELAKYKNHAIVE